MMGRLPWGIVLNMLAERIIAADPEAAEARRNDEARKAHVTAGQSNEHGRKTLVAKAEAGDVIAVLGTLDLLADCLSAHGHDGTRDQLRARALGVVANPAEALALLLRHALVDKPTPAPHTDDQPGPGDDPSDEDALDLFADRRVDPREPGPVPQAADQPATDTDPPPDPPPGPEPGPDPEPRPHGRWMSHLGGRETLERRSSHRVKTHKPGWTVRQSRPGTRYWRTRYGYCYRVDGTGTHPLGRPTLDAFHAEVDADRAAHANGSWPDVLAVIALMREVGARPAAA